MNRFNLIGLLHKSSLSLFIIGSKNQFEEIKIDFPESVVSNSDIFDVEKFSFALKNELIKRPDLKGSEILFLISEEKVFTSSIDVKVVPIEDEKRRLFTQIPITEEEALVTIVTKGNWVQFTAVAKKLLNNLETSLAKVNFKSVFLPLNQLIAFGFGTKHKQLVGFKLADHFNLSVVQDDHILFGKEIELETGKQESILEEIKKIKSEPATEDVDGIILLNDTGDLKDYLEENGVKVGLVADTDSLYETLFKIISKNRSSVTKYLLGEKAAGKRLPSYTLLSFHFKKILAMGGIILVLFLLVGLFIFFKDLGSRSIVTGEKEVNVTPTLTLTPQPTQIATPSALPTATASASAVKKSDLKVKILNGNGIPGDAGRFEKKVNAGGFTDTTTDTADVQGGRDTIVKMSARVTSVLKSEIQKIIDGDYVKVTYTTTLPSDSDIEINTGTRK